MNDEAIEPARLLDDSHLAMDLRSALQGARREGPSDERLAALSVMLEQRAVGSEGSPAQNPRGPEVQAAPVGRRLPIALGGGGLAIAVLASALLWGSATDNSRPEPESVALAPAASASRDPAPASAVERVEPAAARDDAQHPSIPVPTDRAAPKRKATHPAFRPARAQPATPREVEPLSELSLIEQGTRALAHDPALALALVARAERAYPQGNFVQERAVVSIQAQLRLGRRGLAKRLASAFLRSHPDSAYAVRVREMLKTGATGSPPAK